MMKKEIAETLVESVNDEYGILNEDAIARYREKEHKKALADVERLKQEMETGSNRPAKEIIKEYNKAKDRCDKYSPKRGSKPDTVWDNPSTWGTPSYRKGKNAPYTGERSYEELSFGKIKAAVDKFPNCKLHNSGYIYYGMTSVAYVIYPKIEIDEHALNRIKRPDIAKAAIDAAQKEMDAFMRRQAMHDRINERTKEKQ